MSYDTILLNYKPFVIDNFNGENHKTYDALERFMI